jgi:hypothetical protein
MTTIPVVIVEDSEEFADGLKKVLESQQLFPCEVHILNPADERREKEPTFEEFYDEIARCTGDGVFPYYIVLMDNDLSWRWKGANLAPSFHNVIAISTDEKASRWANYVFADKAAIAYFNDEVAKQKFLSVVVEVLKKILPPQQANNLPQLLLGDKETA